MFTQDNTEGYTDEQLDQMNIEFLAECQRLEIDPDSDDAKNVSDEVFSRHC